MTRGAEIQAVIRGGERFRTAHLDVRIIASPHGHTRIGFVVPKHRMTGVRRNQLKRRLREIARLQLLAPLRASAIALDVVIRARYEAYAADFSALRVEMESVGARLTLPARSERPRRKGRD